MNIQAQIEHYIESHPEPKRSEIQAIHRLIQQTFPQCRLWFMDGKNSEGKVVSNPNIGYGVYTIQYADGTDREFYQIGLSGNKTGISLYIMSITDKTRLAKMFAPVLGKATITGYCIKFRSLKNINSGVLKKVIQFGFTAQQ